MTMKLEEREYSLKEAFGVGSDSHTIKGFESSDCQFVPKPEKHWIWDLDVLRDLVVWWQDGEHAGLLLFGPTGAGKSGALQQFCAGLQIPLYEKTIHRGLEFQDLVSQVDLAGGTTIASFSWLTLAMGAEGYPGIFCANEIDRGDPGTLVGLHEVLDGRPIAVHAGALAPIEPQPYFRIAATANTALLGDTTGLYVSSRQQDMALQDRFWMVKIRYLKESEELSLLAEAFPGLPEDVRTVMVSVANEIRAQHMGESDAASALPITMSTRTLLKWATMTWNFRAGENNGQDPLRYALDRALLNATDGMAAGVRKALDVIINGKLGTDPRRIG